MMIDPVEVFWTWKLGS